MILLPSKGRPHHLRRFFCQYYLTGAQEPGVVILEKDDAGNYESVGAPSGWVYREYEGGRGAASHLNKVFAEFPNEPYYALLADDVIPESEEWDATLRAACMPDKIAVPDEGMDRTATHGARYFPTHCFIGGDLVRKWGFVSPPGLDHFYVDNWWFDAGEQVVCPGVKLTHHHFKNGLAEKDETYRARPGSAEAERLYEDFCRAHPHLLFSNTITLHRRKVML